MGDGESNEAMKHLKDTADRAFTLNQGRYPSACSFGKQQLKDEPTPRLSFTLTDFTSLRGSCGWCPGRLCQPGAADGRHNATSTGQCHDCEASHQSGSEQGTGSIATKTSSFRTLEHVCKS